MQYSGPGTGNSHYFFDSRTGDLWSFSAGVHYVSGENYPPTWGYEGKMTKLGGTVVGWEHK